MRLRWTPEAAKDLESISGYLLEQHPQLAQPTVRRIYAFEYFTGRKTGHECRCSCAHHMLFLICAKLFGCQPFSCSELDCLHLTSFLRKPVRYRPSLQRSRRRMRADGRKHALPWHGAVYGRCLAITPIPFPQRDKTAHLSVRFNNARSASSA